MPKKSYSAKQRKLAAVAPPRDKIAAADLKATLQEKEEEKVKLFQRQKDALASIKRKVLILKTYGRDGKLMLKGKTFTENNLTMKR